MTCSFRRPPQSGLPRSACRSPAPPSSRNTPRRGSCRGRRGSRARRTPLECALITSARWPVSLSGRPAPGSSSSTTRGRPTTARAISSSRRSRAPSPPTLTSGGTSSPTNSIALKTAERREARPCAGVLVDHRHVVEHGELLDRLLRLEGAPQAPAGPPVVDHLEQILSEGADRAGRRLDEAGEDVEERRLPGAVRADQAARALRERDAHVVDGRDAGEADREPFDLDHAAAPFRNRFGEAAARASPGPSAPGRPARPGRSAAPAASRRRR